MEAAIIMGRKYIGIELDEHWAKEARLRVQKAKTGVTPKELKQGQIPLFGDKDEANKTAAQGTGFPQGQDKGKG